MSRLVGRSAAAPRPPGVIDTLTAGYETVNRRLWLLLFPIGLDLLFWLGPKLSILFLAGYLPQSTLAASDQGSLLTAEQIGRFNLTFLLAMYVPTVLGMASNVEAVPDLSALVPRYVYPVLPQVFLPSLLVFLTVGLLVAAVYLGGLGQIIRGEAVQGNVVRTTLRFWWRIVALHAIALVVLIVLSIPTVLAIVLAGSLSADLGAFVQMLVGVAFVWLALYFFFALDAVIITDLNPLRAALTSARLVRGNFWSTVGLIGLIWVISIGLPIVWRAISLHPVGLVASIVANAYIGTGLAAASMLYYRDRLQLLRGQDIGNH